LQFEQKRESQAEEPKTVSRSGPKKWGPSKGRASVSDAKKEQDKEEEGKLLQSGAEV